MTEATANDDMSWRRSGAALAGAVAVSAWAGFLLQLYVLLERTVAGSGAIPAAVERLLAYFTILANIAVAAVLTVRSIAPATTLGRRASAASLTGALTAAMIVVALGYHVLLRGLWTPRGLEKVADLLLHTVTPLFLLVYWWATAAGQPVSWREPVKWALFPIGYFAYVLLRGAVLGAYPYPFLDVTGLGYWRVMLNAVGLLVTFLAVGTALVAISRWRSRAARQQRPVRIP